MASGGKKKTTMAKLTRESKLRERRLDKQARKEARKHAPPEEPTDALVAGPDAAVASPDALVASPDAPTEQDLPAQAEQPLPAQD